MLENSFLHANVTEKHQERQFVLPKVQCFNFSKQCRQHWEIILIRKLMLYAISQGQLTLCNNESNVNSEMLIHDSVSIAAQMSKSINDCIERAENVIVFNLKRNIRNQKVKNSDLCFFIKGNIIQMYLFSWYKVNISKTC